MKDTLLEALRPVASLPLLHSHVSGKLHSHVLAHSLKATSLGRLSRTLTLDFGSLLICAPVLHILPLKVLITVSIYIRVIP